MQAATDVPVAMWYLLLLQGGDGEEVPDTLIWRKHSLLSPSPVTQFNTLTKQRPQKAAAAEAGCRDCCPPVCRGPWLCGGTVSCVHQSGSLCEALASWGSAQTTSCYLKAGGSGPTSHQDCKGLKQCLPQAQAQLARVWAAWESETSSCGKVQTFWLRSELFPTSSQGPLMHGVLWTRGCLGKQGPKGPTSSAAFDHCSLGLCWMNLVIGHTHSGKKQVCWWRTQLIMRWKWEKQSERCKGVTDLLCAGFHSEVFEPFVKIT